MGDPEDPKILKDPEKTQKRPRRRKKKTCPKTCETELKTRLRLAIKQHAFGRLTQARRRRLASGQLTQAGQTAKKVASRLLTKTGQTVKKVASGRLTQAGQTANVTTGQTVIASGQLTQAGQTANVTTGQTVIPVGAGGVTFGCSPGFSYSWHQLRCRGRSMLIGFWRDS